MTKQTLARAITATAVAVLLAIPGVSPGIAAPAGPRDQGGGQARLVRTIGTHELGISRPTGVAWDSRRKTLMVTGPHGRGATQVIGISPDEQQKGRWLVPSVHDSGTAAFDPRSDRLTVLQDGTELIVSGTAVTTRRWATRAAARTMRSLDPAGVSYSPDGTLYVLDADADANTIVKLSPEGRVDRTAIRGLDGVALQGIAYEPGSDLVYVADAGGDTLYALDEAGVLTSTHDLSGSGVADLQAMTFAPSGDNTDPATEQSLYIADAGNNQQLGGVTEVSLTPTAVTAASGYSIEPTMTASHPTSAWSPTSPDPSGVTFIPGDGLLASDGEVEEMPLYAGTNLWGARTDGSMTGKTGTTHPAFSDEPTGMEYRASDGHLFISDDTAPTNIFELAGTGADGTFGTADDPALAGTLRTSPFGNTDPEGVAYDSKRDDLLIVDGLSNELYRVDLGADGVFGGDDVITHLDVEGMGMFDPEGVVYDAVRDTVVAVDDSAIWELDENGSLLGKVAISSLNARKPAGITIAPASDGSGQRHYYIVARGLDNDNHPEENDGMLYEVGADLPVISNRPPTANAGPDQAADLGEAVQLSGSGTDDGKPNGALTYRWTTESGPGTVTFGSSSNATTSASFSATGSYVLRLTVSDSDLTAYDELTVDVYNVGALRTTTVRLGAGSDDAREGAYGGGDFVSLSRAHDMLGEDLDAASGAWYPVVTGIRFPDLPVPQGGQVVSARIQFESYAADSGTASVTFQGEASDNAATYEARGSNVSSRPDTTAKADWQPAAWTAAGEAGAAQLSPELAPILQEIVDRPGWAKGNAAAFTVTGTGRRTAKAFETNGGPVLRLQYRTFKPVNAAPVVSVGEDQTVNLPDSAQLSGTVTDDGWPDPPAAVTTAWTKVSGPGTVTFGDPAVVNTTATFSAPGDYVVRLTADDSELTAFDELSVKVIPANTAPVVSAGPDSFVRLPASAQLDGTVTDDGLPESPGTVLSTWSKVQGPGTVTFGDAAKVDTSASFSVAGTYVLRLTSSDGALEGSDQLTVTVKDQPVLTARLSASGIAAGSAASIQGGLTPALTDQPVLLQRWVGEDWTTEQTRTLAAGQGEFSFDIRSSTSAVQRYRVFAPEFGTSAAVASPAVTLRVYSAAIVAVRPAADVVVVKNTGVVRVNLSGWTLRNRRTGRVVTLPAFRLAPGERVRIHTGGGQTDSDDLYLGKRAMWGTHGAAVLRDRAGALISRFVY